MFISEFGGIFAIVLVLTLGLIEGSFKVVNYNLLSKWSTQFKTLDTNKTLLRYFIYGLIESLSSGVNALILGFIGYYISRSIHAKMMYSVLHSKIESFISRVPTGRILNRFSSDISTLDMQTIKVVFLFIWRLSAVLVNMFMFGLIVGYEMIGLCVFMLVMCIYFQRTYMGAKREFLRTASIAKSPILNYLLDTCRGLPYIRAAKQEDWFRNKFMELLDDSSKNEMVLTGLSNWYRIRSCIIITLVVVLPSYLIIIFLKPDLPLSEIVIIILLGSTLGWDLNELLIQQSDLESTMISIERCHHFQMIEPEVQYKSYEEDLKLMDGSSSSIEIVKKRQEDNQETILIEGKVKFSNMSCKYATSANPILRNLSFVIRPGEKIGVIGRTGSGKSTLIKLVWRALDFYEGDIEIDGKSIKEVDLKSLRSQIMVVTQETTLIEGSLRQNIDIRLQDSSRDEEIKRILEYLGFDNPNYIKEGLDMIIDGEGSNLSAGENQLISFARTMLDKKKIMILDEATANIDIKTEENIQKCIDREFKDTTMLIIAHRIQTIMTCDRILILEQGKIAALDTPANLSKQKDSYFITILNKMEANSKR